MAESNITEQGRAPAPSIRERFTERLARERGEPPASPREQPARQERTSGEGSFDEPYDEAGQPDEYTEDATSEDIEDAEFEALDDVDSEQSDESEDTAGIEINGKRYTADDIEQIESSNLELRKAFHRKAAERAAEIKALEAFREDFSREFATPLDQLRARYNALAQRNVADLKPEQVQVWQNQLQQMRVAYHQLKQARDAAQGRVVKELDRARDAQVATSLEILASRDPDRWGHDTRADQYAKLREFAVSSGDWTAEEFDELGDHRIIMGIQAQLDASEIPKHVRDRKTVRPRKPTGRNTPQTADRGANGRFRSAEQAVQESPNAKRDGSFRRLKEAQLARERGGR